MGLLSIINLSGTKSNGSINGNFKLKFEDANFGSNFVYKNNLIKIDNGKLKSYFFNGKISGVFGFDPFFDFNLNLDIKNLSFHKIYKKLSNLNKKTESNLFNLSRKINGMLNLNVDNINSSSDFVDSIESEVEFMNGNIFFHKLLLNF